MTTLSTEYPALRSGATATILYVNGNGETSERTITVGNRYAGSTGITYLRAFCHLRQEDRTFRLDRVLGILETDANGADQEHQPAPAAWIAPRPPEKSAPRSAEDPLPRPAPRPTIAPAPRPPTVTARKKRHPFRRFLLFAAVVFALVLVLEDEFASVSIRETLFPEATAAREAARKERQTPPPPPDAVWHDTYRGQTFQAHRVSGVTTWTLTASGRQFSNAHALRVHVNEALLAASWKIRDPELTHMFGNADANRDGWLSWGEIQQFQNWLYRSYRYMSNDIALTPSEFVAAGGGDCEDWAIVTAALLRFWGMHPAIGSIRSSTGGHAVTVVPASNVPEGYLLITAWDPRNMDHYQEVVYTPIDYDVVGGLSSAVGPDYKLTGVYHPPEMFGRPF